MNPTSDFTPQPEKPLWNSTDVARFFGCSKRHVYTMRKRGLPTIQVGDMIRFDPVQIKAWVQQTALVIKL